MGHAAERPAAPCALTALGIRGQALTLGAQACWYVGAEIAARVCVTHKLLPPSHQCKACVYAWTQWDLSPWPSACAADVIPLHHVPSWCHFSDARYTHEPHHTQRGEITYLRADTVTCGRITINPGLPLKRKTKNIRSSLSSFVDVTILC